MPRRHIPFSCRLLFRRRFCLTWMAIPLFIYFATSPKLQHRGFTSPLMVVDNPVCVRPRLDLWNDRLRKVFAPPIPLNCSAINPNWILVDNGTFRISKEAEHRHGQITCNYTAIRRGKDDFQLVFDNLSTPVNDGSRVTSDVFLANCISTRGRNYSNIHHAIYALPKIIERSKRQISQLPDNSLRFNIIIFGFDSVSRMTWMRNLPKSYKFIVDQLRAVVLKGFNVVGDGTTQALLSMLTGHTETELPEARRGFDGANTVDGFPWIWKQLGNVGYISQWGEQSPRMGTFTYRMLGFRDQPVDHYMRTYYLAAEPDYKRHKPFCVGNVPRHLIMMRALTDFFDAYPSHLRFSFLFHSEYTHAYNNRLQWADDDLLDMLRRLHDRGYLNDSLLIMMSDHGARFQHIRTSEQGKYEERLPFVAVRTPQSFAERYPEAHRHLRENAERLTTAFDLYETLLDVIDFSRKREEVINMTLRARYRRGFSLFEKIPASRTCEDANIEPHWCACLEWNNVNVESAEVRQAAEKLIESINNVTSIRDTECVRLQVDRITSAVRYTPGHQLLSFKRSQDIHGRVADLSDRMNATQNYVQLTVLVRPSGALYEATIKHQLSPSRFIVDMRSVSRINRYGTQPHCVANQLPHLRPYCFCTTQVDR